MSDKERKDFHTLSGERTEDTLENKEKYELREKGKKRTKVENERFMNDDSYGSPRSVHGMLKKDRHEYNKNVVYYNIDYFLVDDCRWVRMCYRTLFEIIPILEKMTWNPENYNRVRIVPERCLDEKCKEGKDLTIRHQMWGDGMTTISNMFKENPKELGNIKSW